MDPFNRVIDLAYATALDFKLGLSLSVALSSMPEASEENESIASHLKRARQLAARQIDREVFLPNIQLGEENYPNNLPETLPFQSLKEIKVIETPNGERLREPASWKAVLSWIKLHLSETVPLRLKFWTDDYADYAFGGFASPSTNGEVRLIFEHSSNSEDKSFLSVLQSSLGLSRRQSQISILINDGLSADAIGTHLNISSHTVRQHIKATYERLGVKKQLELSSIIGQLRLLVSKSAQFEYGAPIESNRTLFRATRFCQSSQSDRQICFGEYGDPEGGICLMFHSSFGGRWITEAAAEAFRSKRLRLLIVERPGVGLTDFEITDRTETVLQDAIDVVAACGGETVRGFSFSGGAFYLAKAIARHPALFSSLCILSPRAFSMKDILDLEETSPLRSLYGLPEDATGLIHEAIDAVDPKSGWQEIIKMLMKENPTDLALLEDADLMQMHVVQARCNLARGVGGVAKEWREYANDLIPPALPNDIPIQIVFGEDDLLPSIQQGVKDWANFTKTDPIRISNAAHLIFLSHTEQVLEALGTSPHLGIPE